MNQSSLCFPDGQKSCFRCCPPVRAPGYDHYPHRLFLARELRDNTSRYDPADFSLKPITGFNCWALGYLDRKFKLVGCLLHPVQNGGRDLRGRIDYGHKCAREFCQEASIFDQLTADHRQFWLGLAEALDSFQYSSNLINPMFRVLNFGPGVLSAVAAHSGPESMADRELISTYPFLSMAAWPRSCAFLVEQIISGYGVPFLAGPEGLELINGLMNHLQTSLAAFLSPKRSSGRPYVHQLSLDRSLADFFRFGLNVSCLSQTEADTLGLQVRRLTAEWLSLPSNEQQVKSNEQPIMSNE
ncbi:MAG: hypothetical protein HQK60_00335 [Deltaproteobacteria bacterium]|nr:hypothetical protein [Deltaproteobacteria bacterium]